MKRLALAFLLLASPAFAQQPPDLTPAYEQLLARANREIAQISVQAQAIAKELEVTKAELAKSKEPKK